MQPNEAFKMSPSLKLVAWTLFLSVLLNFFLVGAFLGVVPHIKHRSFGPMAMAAPHGEYLMGWMARYLEPKDASAFRDAFNGEAEALKEAHHREHQAVSDLASVFQQDPPDPVAMQAALDHLAQARTEVNAVVARILQAAYPKVSPEGRKRLSDLTQNPM